MFHAIYVFIVEVKTPLNVDYVALNPLAFYVGIISDLMSLKWVNFIHCVIFLVNFVVNSSPLK